MQLAGKAGCFEQAAGAGLEASAAEGVPRPQLALRLQGTLQALCNSCSPHCSSLVSGSRRHVGRA